MGGGRAVPARRRGLGVGRLRDRDQCGGRAGDPVAAAPAAHADPRAAADSRAAHRDARPADRRAAAAGAQINFWADRTQINQGECATLNWDVHNVQAVWVYPQGSDFNAFPRTGQGNERVCPP